MPASSARRIAVIATLTASAVGLRLIKHVAVGPLPFLNAPAVFTFVGSAIFGLAVGSSVGLVSFLVSDVIFGLGYWTLINGAIMAMIGALAALTMRWPCGVARIFATSLALSFLYDVTSSVAFYLVLFDFDIYRAAIIALLGLFIPAGGGYLYAVGPIQELATAMLTSTILPVIPRSLKTYIQ